LGIICCFCFGEGHSIFKEFTSFHTKKEVSSNADESEKSAAAFSLA
jgi:hypothetical protein